MADASAGEDFVPRLSSKPGYFTSELQLTGKISKSRNLKAEDRCIASSYQDAIKDPLLDICVHRKSSALDAEADARPSWIFDKKEDLYTWLLPMS